jgi:hypothetical protein
MQHVSRRAATSQVSARSELSGISPVHSPDSAPVEVPAHTVYCIDGHAGVEITAVAGYVWLTQANDPRDIILGRGRSFVLDRKGMAVAYALLDDAVIQVSGVRFQVSGTRPAAHRLPPET